MAAAKHRNERTCVHRFGSPHTHNDLSLAQ